MSQIALITGASSGIGNASALKFAAGGYDVIITGRRVEHLEMLAKKIRGEYNVDVLPLVFDIRQKREVQQYIGCLQGKWKIIDVLVNNAGLSLGLNPINEGLDEDWNTMIDTNIKGLLYISQIVMKGMIERKKGHIINIGSIAGIETYSNNNIYCATKAAVVSITQTMRIDLLKYGIKVTLINPGAVETEFSLVRFKGDEQSAANVYKGFEPLTGADVADAVYYVSSLPPHVNINELTIVPNAQASPFYSFKTEI